MTANYDVSIDVETDPSEHPLGWSDDQLIVAAVITTDRGGNVIVEDATFEEPPEAMVKDLSDLPPAVEIAQDRLDWDEAMQALQEEEEGMLGAHPDV
jgi:hypothetical protein